eukprot:54217-Lingulodinium_polyedra.AAC.1
MPTCACTRGHCGQCKAPGPGWPRRGRGGGQRCRCQRHKPQCLTDPPLVHSCETAEEGPPEPQEQ